MKNKGLKLGYYHIVIAAILIAIIIILNMIIAALPSRYTVYDSTGKDLYDLTDTTENVLDSLDKEIEIVLIAEDGNEDPVITELADRYAQLSDKIDFEIIDPVVTPEYTSLNASKHDLSTYSTNTVIVSGGIRERLVQPEEFYEMIFYSDTDYQYYSMFGIVPEQYGSNFIGEEVLTSALDYIDSPLPKVYFTTGHGEATVYSEILSALSSANYQSASLSLLQEGVIPSDANCIIINNPEKDITDIELSLFYEYVNNGGSLIMITDIAAKDDSFKNVKALGSYYGMEHLDGKLVEADADRYNSEYNILIPYLSGSDVITKEFASETYAILPSSSFTVNDSSESGALLSRLIATSESAYVENEAGEKVYEGECVIGAKATVKGVNYAENGSFVWYTTPSMTDETSIYGGAQITLMSIATMSNTQSPISIEGKDVTAQTLIIDDNSINFWTTTMTYVVPLGVLLVGFGIWMVRRNRG